MISPRNLTKTIRNLIVPTGNALTTNIIKTLDKVEERLDVLKSDLEDACIDGLNTAEETALKLHYKKETYYSCIIIQNCTTSDVAKEVLNHITEETIEDLECWSIELNNKHPGVCFDDGIYTEVIQMKALKLKNVEKYASISIRPLKGPVEVRIVRSLLEKANNLNQQEDTGFNGKTFKIAEGKFRVIDRAIRFVPN